jgi:ComF family protein
VWITTNYGAIAQELIQVYKFGHLRAAAQPLTGMMGKTLRSFVNPAELKVANYLVVPLPTATSRVRRRGFDHSALLAKQIAQQLGLEYCQALGRLGQSRQVGASRQLRLSQSAGDYFVRQPQRLNGRNILLIDDVITTGGSLIAASKSLRVAEVSHVDALVFAKRL